VPEQAIMDSFRLILIEAAKNEQASSPSERQVIGNIYEVREPGEQFTKEALLQIAYSRDEISVTNPNQLGIYGYNSKTKAWEYIDSKRDENRNTIIAKVQKLHPYYALMTSDLTGEGSVLEPALQERSHIQQVSTVAFHGHNFVRNTFEDGLGEWSNRDNEVGARVTLDNTATFDETHTVKITNTHVGGNFAVNVITTPFDVRDYPLVQFDYRIPPEVKTNILVKVSGRWYDIGFTDDPKKLKDKRVNIAHIGDINNIVSDDQWHTARFNLYDMLRTKTGNTRAEAMIMADWDVGGYMKLQFGKNAKDATYYIDNFTISREIVADLRIDSNILLVDNFNQKKATNALGGATTIFFDGKKERLETTFSEKDAVGKGHALALSYDVSDTGNYAGYGTGLQNLDLRGYQSITFFVKGAEVGQDIQVGLKDASDHESKVIVSHYLPEKIETTWQKVTIPLVAFSRVLDWGKLKNLSFSVENRLHGKGVVFVDNIEFQNEIKSFIVDNFERLDRRNSVGREQYTFVSGAAAINGQHAKGSPNGIYRLSYGGNIGTINAYASDLKSYAGWTTKLGGIDCSQCGTLSFRIRGAKGGENSSLYLVDGNFRWGVDVAKYAKVTTSWQRVIIPLREFADYGTDLTHLAELQFVFEGEKMSGTIYLDDICFGHEGN
jgi:carbohydrate binding protein with CBM30 domain/carbohydrate binding protein with CBM11 domain